MIDPRRLRTDLDGVKTAMARRGDPELLDQLDAAADLDAQGRGLGARRDDVRRRINELSKQVGALRRTGDADAAERAAAESRALGDTERDLAEQATAIDVALRALLLAIPNVPADEAPDGASDADNPVLRTVGFDPDAYAPHQRVPHWEIGSELGILDAERAATIAGSMFTMLRGMGATLARGLCQLGLDRNADAYEEIRPPTLVSTATLTATGQLPKFADDAYAVERDDLWCVPTAEVPLTSIGRDEIYDEADLPVRLMACTPCYRREAGSAGRDTRGLLRSHEFDKVEILAYATPASAPAMLDELVGRAEASLVALGLAYRAVEICAGALGQTHHRSIDLEVYAPGCDAWLEVSSISWFSDYQARRANIRYRPGDAGAGAGAKAKGTELVHTLNGSALAVPRVLAALLETHRQPDGSIAVPEALHPYTRGVTTVAR